MQVGHRGRGRARLRPPAGPGPPGHQAGQPAVRRRPAAPHRRLRPGPGAGRGVLDRAGRRHPGHGPLLRPRTGRGMGARRQGRRLRPGPGALRGGHRRGPLHRRHHGGHPHGPGGRRCCPSTRPSGRSTTCWCGRPPPSPPSGTTPPNWPSASEAVAVTLPDPAPLPIVERGADRRDRRRGARSSVPRGPSAAVRTSTARPDRARGPALIEASHRGRASGAAQPTAKGDGRSAGARTRRRWPWVAAIAVRRGRPPAPPGWPWPPRPAVHTQPPGAARWWARPWPRPARRVKATTSTSAPPAHVYSITVGRRPDPEPAARPRSGGQTRHGQAGLDHRRGRLRRPAAGRHPHSPRSPPATTPSQALKDVHLVGVCPASAQQYSSTVAAGARARHVADRDGPVRLDGDHHHLQGPRAGGGSRCRRSRHHLRLGLGRPHGGRASCPRRATSTARPVPAGRSSAPRRRRAGPQPFGSTVTVDVSLGPQPVIIPDVVGQSVAAATAALEALGPAGRRPLRTAAAPPRCCRRTRPPGPRSAAGHHGRYLHLVTRPDPGCELCEAARITEWFHEDDVCWVAACEVCDVPMVVWKQHGNEPPDAEVEHMLADWPGWPTPGWAPGCGRSTGSCARSPTTSTPTPAIRTGGSAGSGAADRPRHRPAAG